jgi:D-3-phosphoglycerate dehydrogenase
VGRPIVLFTQPIAASAMERISKLAELRVATDRSEESLASEIKDASVLVVRDPIAKSVIGAGKSLRLVARHGVGTDYIPVEECTRLAIPVTITPGANTSAVVEWVIGSMIALSHRFGTAMRYTSEGEWKKREGLEGFEIAGKTLGIVGLGRIGSALSVLATAAFRMRVLAFDPSRDATQIAEAGGVKCTLENVLEQSDFISLHLPSSADTRNIIDTGTLPLMKRGTILINGARGALVDTSALLDALASGQIGGAALDGVEGEPLPRNHPLLGRDNVILTPHSAALTEEALLNMGHMVADEVERVLSGDAPINIIN